MMDGLKTDLNKFKCQECGACCRQTGYVRLKPDEPDAIAAFLCMDVYEFIEKYTKLTDDRQTLSLTDKDGTDCIFLQPDGCRIHPVKPSQCKGFPLYWKFSDFYTTCQWAIKSMQESD